MTSVPLEIVVPLILALATTLSTAIGVLWKTMKSDREKYDLQLKVEREKAELLLNAERAKTDALEAEYRGLLQAQAKELRETREKRHRDQELYLRSLGVRPLSSLPPKAGTR